MLNKHVLSFLVRCADFSGTGFGFVDARSMAQWVEIERQLRWSQADLRLNDGIFTFSHDCQCRTALFSNNTWDWMITTVSPLKPEKRQLTSDRHTNTRVIGAPWVRLLAIRGLARQGLIIR